MQFSNVRISVASIMAATVLTAGAAAAGTLVVSSNGADTVTCGTTSPCRTIAAAVVNAFDGDTIAVLPGTYAGATIDKSLSLYSSSGMGGAVITGTLDVTADGTVIGKSGKGFTFSNSATGVSIAADDVTVRGNAFSGCTTAIALAAGSEAVIRDNTVNDCAFGVSVVAATGAEIRGNRFGFMTTAAMSFGALSSAAVVRENRTYGPSGAGFSISGSGHLFYRNLVHGSTAGGFVTTGAPSNVILTENLVVRSNSPAYFLQHGSGWVLNKNAVVGNNAPGFYLSAGNAFALNGNMAIGSNGQGFLLLDGSNHVLIGNSAIDNSAEGIVLSTTGSGVTIAGGNLFGNGGGNCGLTHASTSAVTVTNVYWGDAAGPGPDPADTICGNIGVVSATEHASSRATMKMPRIK